MAGRDELNRLESSRIAWVPGSREKSGESDGENLRTTASRHKLAVGGRITRHTDILGWICVVRGDFRLQPAQRQRMPVVHAEERLGD